MAENTTIDYQQIGMNAALTALQQQRNTYANENVNLRSIVSILSAKVETYEKQLGIETVVNGKDAIKPETPGN